jgi:CDP-diacylglycerol--serine O-phosphatidyltransferase
MNERPRKKRNFRSVSLYWLLPNILTISGFVSGLTALRFAMDGRWAGVIVLISVAAVFDALDGRTARRFQTSSAFGAALDSLSDMVVFGVVPALCLYIWALQGAGTIAWWATLFYAVSIALRLARFNSELTDPPEYAKNYFTGIPAPASGFLVLLPIVIDLQFKLEIVQEARWVSAWLVLVVLPVLATIGLLGAAVVTEPWLAYMAVVLTYALSLPLSTLRFIRQRQHHEKDIG